MVSHTWGKVEQWAIPEKKQTGESKFNVILFGISPHLEFLGYFSFLETFQNFVITPSTSAAYWTYQIFKKGGGGGGGGDLT